MQSRSGIQRGCTSVAGRVSQESKESTRHPAVTPPVLGLIAAPAADLGGASVAILDLAPGDGTLFGGVPQTNLSADTTLSPRNVSLLVDTKAQWDAGKNVYGTAVDANGSLN